MDILVIGGGGREHAICHSLKKSPKVGNLYCLPGNAGISKIATCVNIGVMEFDKIRDFVRQHKNIGMVMVAPDDPLAAGLVDVLEKDGVRVFGPHANAAIIEGSKAFSKWLMKKYNIPTANYEEFTDYNEAVKYVEGADYPLVVKADGLALGKGVIICENVSEAKDALYEMMIDKKFKAAGNRVIIEEFLVGREVSILAFTDGKTIKPMVSSQDHKRAFDNDEGLNTGGMGTFSPSKIYTKEVEEYTYKNIIIPTVNAMNAEGRTFKGVLYFGLMLTDKGVKVLEYNARFGDPETQVVLPRLKTDLVDIFEAVIDERLDQIDIEWDNNSAVCVILASGGYPEHYVKGYPIEIGNIDDDCMLFHAGTALDENGNFITNGGRVLGVTCLGHDIEEARAKAYRNIDKINFKDKHYRKDIGIKL